MSCSHSGMKIVVTICLTQPLRKTTRKVVETTPLYDWDEAKRAANLAKHRVDFMAADDFDWATAHVKVDDREDYGELREVAWGFIGERLHVLAFTRRRVDDGEVIWIISLRKGEKRDVRKYVEATRRDLA
jgi:uncharacterized protein